MNTESLSLAGRRILLTGGSSGIGAATAEAIVSKGGRVAVLARREDRLRELADRLGSAVLPIRCDVTDHDGVRAAAQQAAAEFDGLDGVVANAGSSFVGSIFDGDPRSWAKAFDLLLLGALVTIQAALAHFPSDGRRDVIAVGSTGSLRTLPGMIAYGGAKRGLEASIESMRLELAPHGIAVGMIYPGDIKTEVIEHSEVSGTVPPGLRTPPRLVEGTVGLPATTVADAIVFMLAQRSGGAINSLVLRPVGQLNP